MSFQKHTRRYWDQEVVVTVAALASTVKSELGMALCSHTAKYCEYETVQIPYKRTLAFRTQSALACGERMNRRQKERGGGGG